MLSGDKSTFAIECEIRDAVDSFVYCNFRFWIAGKPIGDWDEELVLGVLMNSAVVYMRYQGNRCLDIANNMNTEQLWNHIDRVVNSDDPDELHMSLECRYRQRYLLHEISDGSVATVCKVILVYRNDGMQRLLWKSKGANNIQEMTLPKLTVDKAVADFLHWATMNKLANWITQACDTLGLRADIGFSVVLNDGYELHTVARIRDVGAANGMLVVCNYDEVRAYADELIQAGYGYSVLDEPLANETFDLDTYRDMFLDWGWSGVEPRMAK